MAPPRDDKTPPSDETNSLLSGGYASTYDGIQVHNEEDTDHPDDHTEAQSVFSNIADNVSTMASAIHDGMEAVAEVAIDMKDAVVEAAVTVEHVVEDIAEELQTTFVEIVAPDLGDEEELPAEDEAFSMQLTRGTSILPSDIAQAAAAFDDAMKHPEDEEEAFSVADTSIPISAYFMLASAVVGLSSIGPLLDLQDGVSGTLKIIWRTQATALMLLPFAIYGIREEGIPTLTAAQIIILVAASACYASMCIFFAWSLDFTTVGNAVILSNCQAILLLIGKAAMGEVVSLKEGVGAVIAFSGAIFCSRDSAETTDSTMTGGLTIVGDLYALLSAVAGVLYLITAKTVRPYINLYFFMFVVMSLGTLCGIGFAFLNGSEITFDRHIDHGVFGWMHLHTNRFPVEVIMVVACNILGAMGYVRCMVHFSTVIIAVATLLEPVVAEVTAVLLGVGVLPGWMGWLGNVLVLFGTLTVVYHPPSTGSKNTFDH